MIIRLITLRLWTSAWVSILMTSHAFAGFVIGIEHEIVAPGGTALVAVFATSDMGNNISGFNLPLDVGADGKKALPVGFTYHSPPILNALFNNTALDLPEPQITIANVDAIPSGFVQANQAVILSQVPTKLFDLVIDVGSGVPAGTVVPIYIVRDSLGLFNVTSPNGGAAVVPDTGRPAIGSITVIPEPGGFMQIGAIVVLIAGVTVVQRLRVKLALWR